MAAEMGNELKLLKEQHEQGLLTDDLYKICVEKAVAKYGQLQDAAPPPPQTPPPPPAYSSSYSTYGGSSAFSPYSAPPTSTPAFDGKGMKGMKGGGMKGGKSGKSGKGWAAPHAAAAPIQSLPHEPQGPVVRQMQGTRSLPVFDPKQDRSAQYASPAAADIAARLRDAVQAAGGDMLLVVAAAGILRDIAIRDACESVLGSLSPHAFAAFAATRNDIRIVKELRHGCYKDQWYLSDPAAIPSSAPSPTAAENNGAAAHDTSGGYPSTGYDYYAAPGGLELVN